MSAIRVQGLSKVFNVKEKRQGLRDSIQSLFRPVYKEKTAVRPIDFAVEEGEILAFMDREFLSDFIQSFSQIC